jgi:hypothetical protein
MQHKKQWIIKNSKNGIVSIIIIVFIIAFFIWRNDNKKLLSNHFYTVGKIYNPYAAYRGGINIMYTYIVNNVTYKKETTIFIKNRYLDFFLNKYFLVTYENGDPENQQILILPKDYSKYSLEYPDSLNWVKNLE